MLFVVITSSGQLGALEGYFLLILLTLSISSSTRNDVYLNVFSLLALFMFLVTDRL